MLDVGREYVAIVLRLRQLMPDWVECSADSPALVGGLDVRQEDRSAGALSEVVQELAKCVRHDEAPSDRQRWLLAQLGAIATALRWLDGELLTYSTLFELCHGASVEFVPDRQFERAHALLDRSLPGDGDDVGPRYRAWRETQLVPVERVEECLHLLSAELRRRCRALVGLPDGEQVTWELVTGAPWAAHTDYLGQRTTRIRINRDLPISSSRLLELVSHEAYPGHHTEAACKQASLIQHDERVELTAYVYPTPQALISEGLASYAQEALLGDDADRVAAACLRHAGVAYDHATATVVRQAETLLLPVRSNIALLLDDGSTSAQVREYAQRWLLDDRDQIDEAVRNLEGRSWRPYESCYPVGLALCRRYAAGDPQRFRELLHRQLTPADLTE